MSILLHGGIQGDGMAIGDSKHPADPPLTFRPAAWREFLSGVRLASDNIAAA